MADSVDKKTRSRIMANIRGKDTKPELMLRLALFRLGFRYRLHNKHLPGKPDLTLPKHRAVIFVNGCFWHRHNCRRSRLPLSNVKYWASKIARNQKRDEENYRALRSADWRVLVVWECALTKAHLNKTTGRVASWVSGNKKFAIIEPKKKGARH